jgi:hypothetical protein
VKRPLRRGVQRQQREGQRTNRRDHPSNAHIISVVSNP